MKFHEVNVTPERTKSFWRHVDKGEGCWNWTGALFKNRGYGMFQRDKAHRYSYALHSGPIQDGMVVMHTCDNRRCVNPEHLRMGTFSENTFDCIGKGRFAPNTILNHLERVKRGEANGMSKLTADQVREIRAQAEPYTRGKYADIGRRFGVSGIHVKKIVQRKRWAHLASLNQQG